MQLKANLLRNWIDKHSLCASMYLNNACFSCSTHYRLYAFEYNSIATFNCHHHHYYYYYNELWGLHRNNGRKKNRIFVNGWIDLSSCSRATGIQLKVFSEKEEEKRWRLSVMMFDSMYTIWMNQRSWHLTNWDSWNERSTVDMAIELANRDCLIDDNRFKSRAPNGCRIFV